MLIVPKMCLMYQYYHMISRQWRNKDVQLDLYNLDKMRVYKGHNIYNASPKNSTFKTQSNSACMIKLRTRVVAAIYNEPLSTSVSQLHSGMCFSCHWVTPSSSWFIFKCYSATCSHNIASKDSILDSNLVKSHSPMTSSLVKIHRAQQ